MAKKINPTCAKCGKGLSVHLQKPGVGHTFVAKKPKKKNKYVADYTEPTPKVETVVKKKTGGFIEPGIENID
tara:strand:+ start:573 stop:788 length:216 start_codon:yes stop_codon:yes gene_type:complete